MTKTFPSRTQTYTEQKMTFAKELPAPKKTIFYAVGLDLGKSQDYSARVTARYDLAEPDFILRIGEIKRYDLHTPYPSIVEDTVNFLHKINKIHASDLIIDNGGVGAAVLDMFTGKLPLPTKIRAKLVESIFGANDERVQSMHRMADDDEMFRLFDLHEAEIMSALSPLAINITAGKDPNINKNTTIASPVFNVPKEDLVGAVQFFLQTGRLQIDSKQALKELAFNELKNFQMKATAKNNMQWEARDGAHDDIVLAIALVCWFVFRQITDAPLLWA